MPPTPRTPQRHVFLILDMAHEDERREQRALPATDSRAVSLSPCSDCAARCCTAVVYLTAVEALRIALTLAIPLDELVDVQADDGDLGAHQSVPIPLDGGPARLTLKQVATTDACIFLHQVGARRRCSIHGLRPGACIQYPHRMQVDDMIISAGAPTLCPIGWVQNEAVATRLERDIRGWYRAMDEERALVAAWAAHDDTDRSFAAFTRFARPRVCVVAVASPVSDPSDP